MLLWLIVPAYNVIQCHLVPQDTSPKISQLWWLKGKQQGGPADAQGKLAVISPALEIGQLLTSPALSSHQGGDSKTGVRDFKSSDPTALKISFASDEEVIM